MTMICYSHCYKVGGGSGVDLNVTCIDNSLRAIQQYGSNQGAAGKIATRVPQRRGRPDGFAPSRLDFLKIVLMLKTANVRHARKSCTTFRTAERAMFDVRSVLHMLQAFPFETISG